MMKVLLTLLVLCISALGYGSSAMAQEDPDYARKLELSQKMHEFRPVADQVNGAIDRYAETQVPSERETFKTAMRNVFNYKALEKISIDAYVETFSLPELEAMVEYYSKPEARSASEKFDQYAAIVYPEIVKMMDKAAMRVKTGN